MLQKMFLKLDGVTGESKSPRHFGEIEIFKFYWGHGHQMRAGGGPGKAGVNDLTISKRFDKTSPILMSAWTRGQNFSEGFLTIEELSESGGLIRSVAFKFTSVLIHFVTVEETFETIALNFEGARLVCP
ncbi:MAG: type VI secretion system tube protein Hcp [Pyrinomonadaceae bacterium]